MAEGRVKASRTGSVERTRTSNDVSLLAGQSYVASVPLEGPLVEKVKVKRRSIEKEKDVRASIGTRSDWRSYRMMISGVRLTA